MGKEAGENGRWGVGSLQKGEPPLPSHQITALVISSQRPGSSLSGTSLSLVQTQDWELRGTVSLFYHTYPVPIVMGSVIWN